MLKSYEIEIKEVLCRVQKVEAESVGEKTLGRLFNVIGEAIDKAMEMYYGQEIILDAEDMQGVDFMPMEKQNEKSR